jgi:hypothetical protein
MAGNKKTDEQPKPNENTRPKPQSHTDQAQLVQSLIDSACKTDEEGRTVRDEASKITTADLIRLMQFQREMVKGQPVDIVEMRWIDPPKS